MEEPYVWWKHGVFYHIYLISAAMLAVLDLAALAATMTGFQRSRLIFD